MKKGNTFDLPKAANELAGPSQIHADGSAGPAASGLPRGREPAGAPGPRERRPRSSLSARAVRELFNLIYQTCLF